MQITQQDWVRRLNYLGAAVGGAGRLLQLDADELIAEACAGSGLDDFGDAGWEEPFRRLVASLEKDVALHTLGRLLTRADLLRALRNRLFVTAAHRNDPTIAQRNITAPLLIAGQGRTGTSILFELLALDTRNRAPLAWEAASPVEPPAATLGGTVTRGQIAETVNEFWVDIQPALSAAHEYRWDLPVECIRFLDSDFSTDWWAMLYGAWDWLRWRAEARPRSAYPWHRSILQLLQGQDQHPRRWLLKSPAHLGALDQLLAQYPDLLIIHTHRDPLKSVPSTVSLSTLMRASRADGVDPALVAQLVVGGYSATLRKVIEERANGTIAADRIVDVHFQSLMKNPVTTIEAVYDRFGLSFHPAFADSIREYLQRKPRGRFGTHSYHPADYGLSEQGIRDAFRFYTDHYDIALEH
ncbi:MAG: sulfotransferase [Pseudomonadales bacterium]|jgi:hypothetical protein|nr:sulfotransferase [Pseudomonadales bacterium]MCP5321255.1 sulfotransferase [Pseudomonadales bacterium]MCP5336169.1 sulfotransferase [Pseudomonadales bacterium]